MSVAVGTAAIDCLDSLNSAPSVYGSWQSITLNVRTTCTNSSKVKPDLCVDQDQQYCIKVKRKTKCKAERTAKKGNFIAPHFG